MKKQQIILSLFFAGTCMFFANKASFAEPANLGLLMNELKTYHDSGAYETELAHAIEKAQAYIDHRAKTKLPQQKLAIVLDIDETSLSNYNKFAARQYVGTPTQIHDDILSGDAPAIAPMLALYNDALKQGISVFFVTGRRERDRQITITNLTQSGYHDWAGLALKSNDYNLPSTIPFKSQERAKITQQGYTIIADIGDQYSDLKGGYAEKTFKLPNPYYYLN